MTFDDRQVCILSKGRPDAPSMTWFPGATIFVEPREMEMYREANPKAEIVSVERDDCGTPLHARKVILDRARATLVPIIMLDDDLHHLYRRTSSRRKPYEKIDEGAPVRDALLADVIAGPYAVASIGRYGSFASSKQALGARGIVRQVIAINPRRLPQAVEFDQTFPLLHDLDFTIQLLARRIPYHVRFDFIGALEFRGYEDRTETAMSHLLAKWGPNALSIRRGSDGALKSVAPNYRAFGVGGKVEKPPSKGGR